MSDCEINWCYLEHSTQSDQMIDYKINWCYLEHSTQSEKMSDYKIICVTSNIQHNLKR